MSKMQTTVKLTGMKEIERALGEVKSATAKSKMRKVLKQSGEPVAKRARGLVAVDDGDLRESIDVSPVLTRSQRRQNPKGYFADLEMHIGPSGLVQGITQEFGTIDQAANPFMRPAWDGMEMKTLDTIGALAWAEIQKKARR
jgi:HK97 gp10 family phage protein